MTTVADEVYFVVTPRAIVEMARVMVDDGYAGGRRLTPKEAERLLTADLSGLAWEVGRAFDVASEARRVGVDNLPAAYRRWVEWPTPGEET